MNKKKFDISLDSKFRFAAYSKYVFTYEHPETGYIIRIGGNDAEIYFMHLRPEMTLKELMKAAGIPEEMSFFLQNSLKKEREFCWFGLSDHESNKKFMKAMVEFFEEEGFSEGNSKQKRGEYLNEMEKCVSKEK